MRRLESRMTLRALLQVPDFHTFKSQAPVAARECHPFFLSSTHRMSCSAASRFTLAPDTRHQTDRQDHTQWQAWGKRRRGRSGLITAARQGTGVCSRIIRCTHTGRQAGTGQRQQQPKQRRDCMMAGESLWPSKRAGKVGRERDEGRGQKKEGGRRKRRSWTERKEEMERRTRGPFFSPSD